MVESRQAQDIDNQHIDILIELKEHLSQLHMKGFKG
jgi:predicted O-linked N-acetylglucosamine transferase (SPINDLY family)